MTTANEIKAELRRIAKAFRRHEREDRRAAEKERKHGNDVSASYLEGNASGMKYCADHVEHYVARMVNSKPQGKKETD